MSDVTAGGRPLDFASAAMFVLVAVSAIGAATIGHAVFTWVGMAATLVYLALQAPRVPRFQAVMAAVLIGLGLAAGASEQNVWDVLVAGLVKAQVFLVLFFAIAWLQVPASASPALRAVRRTVVSQPPGRRFLYLAGGGHLLGSVLNIVGLVLLSSMVERQSDRRLQRRMATALMQGFVAASTWSPFYVSVVVVIVALPELDWSLAIGGGLPLAVITVACAWAVDRAIYRRPGGSPAAQPPGLPLVAGHRFNLGFVLASLVVIVIGTVEATGLALPIVLAFVAPPFGVLWMVFAAGPSAPATRSAARLAGAVYGRLPGLRNEALAFTAASIFGVGVAAGFPAEWLDDLPDMGAGVVPALVFGLVALGACGLHPVIPVVLIGEAIPPETLGLSPEVMGLSLLGAWGLSTLVSPFSGTTLMMSRFTGVPSHVIAWRWNALYAVIAAAAVSLWLIALWRMQVF